MTHQLDRNQELRSSQDEVYMSGVADAANGCLPTMSEIVYLNGYCKGMEQIRAEVGLKITVSAAQLQSELFTYEDEEYPLLCNQCTYLIGKTCALKATTRNGNQYACDQILVDSHF